MDIMRIDMTGQVYGRLTFISYHSSYKNGNSKWNCLCSCGNKVVVSATNARMGIAKSCGCWSIEASRIRQTTHGEGGKTKEWRAWRGITFRTSLDERYISRGIKMCKRWENSYENFLADMGRSPSPTHSIDRIDNNGNYEPSNCRWATRKEQANNRSSNKLILYNGQKKTISEWCDKFHLKYSSVLGQLRRNKTLDYIINEHLLK